MRRVFLIALVCTLLILTINGCCEPKTIIKKEYIECKYPTILDLNYTNDTNYTIPIIDFEIVEKVESNVSKN